MSSEEIKLSAVNLGFDTSWIADVLTGYGQDVLSLAVEAARNGLTVGLIIEIVQKFGPSLLQLIVNLIQHRHSMAFAASEAEVFPPVPPTVPGPVLPSMDSSLVTVIIQQFLPTILEKFGPTLIQALIQVVTEMLQNNQNELIKTLVNSIMNALQRNQPAPNPLAN